ncbi:unnamed protein product [Tilletia controversa]|uniref:Uncharacterized protein n=1 Tax=Tilletia controversa TaxID=13291 RepID=A0A8X7MME2_9BASI|nr:hypothetical protein CF328_g7490 [Tilletia controversa]KAE8241025.1 hypothetical protein A4X06_0g7689 [Tilletia controversa]CAD6919651.1 unnamed protein product [Tilletia controversa]CAD6955721.1 unnamed protein product [Tilletia controversa]CAD6978825.1 unnamed protein product [Tilletia controversa]
MARSKSLMNSERRLFLFFNDEEQQQQASMLMLTSFDRSGSCRVPRVWDCGVWDMMKTISRSREGILGLWKGTFASFLLKAGSSFYQRS